MQINTCVCVWGGGGNTGGLWIIWRYRERDSANSLTQLLLSYPHLLKHRKHMYMNKITIILQTIKSHVTVSSISPFLLQLCLPQLPFSQLHPLQLSFSQLPLPQFHLIQSCVHQLQQTGDGQLPEEVREFHQLIILPLLIFLAMVWDTSMIDFNEELSNVMFCMTFQGLEC